MQSTDDSLPLPGRSVVSVTGIDAVGFLDNLVTSALDLLNAGEARFAALLTPQGKIAFEFFALRTTDGFLLETDRKAAPDFAKRLAMYKLRAKVTIGEEVGLSVAVGHARPSGESRLAFSDPRHPDLGLRYLLRGDAGPGFPNHVAMAKLAQLRVSLGVPEAGIDYVIGDTFPHEACYDRFNGVSFKKGCFVGQEVVARMQNKSVVRKRVVKVVGDAALTSGALILHGQGEIGRVGTVAGREALAMLRLDRALEARNQNAPLTADGVTLTVSCQELAAYETALAARPVIDL